MLAAIRLLWSVLDQQQDTNNHTGKDAYFKMRDVMGKAIGKSEARDTITKAWRTHSLGNDPSTASMPYDLFRSARSEHAATHLQRSVVAAPCSPAASSCAANTHAPHLPLVCRQLLRRCTPQVQAKSPKNVSSSVSARTHVLSALIRHSGIRSGTRWTRTFAPRRGARGKRRMRAMNSFKGIRGLCTRPMARFSGCSLLSPPNGSAPRSSASDAACSEEGAHRLNRM